MTEITPQPNFPAHRGAELQENLRLNNGIRGVLNLFQRGADVGLGAATGGLVGNTGGLAALSNSLVSVQSQDAVGGGLDAGGLSDQFGNFETMMTLQLQVQQMMQQQTMESNIAKTAHDAKMNTVRNMKA